MHLDLLRLFIYLGTIASGFPESVDGRNDHPLPCLSLSK